MPYPNEHACRLKDPGDFQSDSMKRMHRNHEGKDYSIIMGRLMGEDTMTEQAYRYGKDAWTTSEAQAHCRSHGGTFEAASENKAATGFEIRSFALEELRIETIGDMPHIRGHAAVFNQMSEPISGMFREIIQPGAFKKTLQEADVRALFNHDPNYVLGRSSAGTLFLTEDRKGLAVDIVPPDTQWARDLMVSMNRGDIKEMSFGFKVPEGKDKWSRIQDPESGLAIPLRKVLETRLFDVSPTTFPAYTQTDAAVRAAIQALQFDLPPEPPQEEHSEEEPPKQHSLLVIAKRRLQLLELRR